jgi:hypothetical protein
MGTATAVRQCCWLAFCLGVVVLLSSSRSSPRPATFVKWSISQWLPEYLGSSWQTEAWLAWERQQAELASATSYSGILDIPTIDVQNEWGNALKFLEQTYGNDWRKRPLLLKNLWTANDLASPQRRLSLSGLLQENMTIPYYFDSRIPRNLSPDAQGPIRDIMTNITTHRAPHKIGSQLLLQRYPELIREVAPTEFVTSLFGDYFNPQSIKGSGPLGIFPGLTTVPLFVAHSNLLSKVQESSTTTVPAECKTDSSQQQQSFEREGSAESCSESSSARTDLHCEPIGNVAVQLEGEKHWTLVSPEYSFRLRPRLAPDGRAFFASWLTDISNVPRYEAVTGAGDAMWVPTWTWHRVDYVVADKDGKDKHDNTFAIGASLFHFRVLDFWENNPLFGFLIIPSLFKELVGYNTQ